MSQLKIMASKQFIRGFIELYHRKECLWKTTCPDYTNKHLKNNGYAELLVYCKQFYKEADKAFVQQKIQNLRTTFRKEFKKVEESKRNATTSDDIHIPKLWYFDLLLFTIDCEQPNQTTLKNRETNDVLPFVKFAFKKMPKVMCNPTWIEPYPELRLDGEHIFCTLCSKMIYAKKKFIVDQHVKTAKHVRKLDKRGNSQGSLGSCLQPPTSRNDQLQFNEDLCKAMASSNLNNKNLISYLQRYGTFNIPEERCVDSVYKVKKIDSYGGKDQDKADEVKNIMENNIKDEDGVDVEWTELQPTEFFDTACNENTDDPQKDLDNVETQNSACLSGINTSSFRVSNPVKIPKRIGAQTSILVRKSEEDLSVCTEDAQKNITYTTPTIDEFDALGISWAAKVRKLDADQKVLAEDLINQVLKRAHFKELTRTTEIHESSCRRSISEDSLKSSSNMISFLQNENLQIKSERDGY